MELYPTELRATGHGFATAFSRFGGVVSVFFLPTLQAELGNGGLLLVLAGAGLIGVLTTWWLGSEMAGQALPEMLEPGSQRAA